MLKLLSGLLEVTRLQVTKLRFRPRSIDWKLLAIVPNCVPGHRPLYASHLLGLQVEEDNDQNILAHYFSFLLFLSFYFTGKFCWDLKWGHTAGGPGPFLQHNTPLFSLVTQLLNVSLMSTSFSDKTHHHIA